MSAAVPTPSASSTGGVRRYTPLAVLPEKDSLPFIDLAVPYRPPHSDTRGDAPRHLLDLAVQTHPEGETVSPLDDVLCIDADTEDELVFFATYPPGLLSKGCLEGLALKQ